MKRLSGWSQLCARVVCAGSVVLMMGLAVQAAAAPEVSGGSHTSVALKTDGSLWAWGDQAMGQYVGESICTYGSNTPRMLSTGFASVATGSHFSVALKTDGSLWGWGSNQYGPLTNGVIYDGTCIPQQIGTGFAKVSAGDNHTVAIKTDGSLWAWGWDLYGQLGDGSAPNYFVDVVTSNSTPQQIGTGFASVSVGANHTVAIKTDGSLWAWGDNTYGQLGDGTFDALSNGVSQHPTPKQIGTGFASVFAGPVNTFAIKTDGSLWAWGGNDYGQLGDGTIFAINPTPQQIGTGFVSVVASYQTTVAIKTDGSLWAWGSNMYGQFGDGTTTDSLIPKLVGTGFAKVAVSRNSSAESYLAIKTDGSLWAWGFTEYGQIGDGNNIGDYLTWYQKTPKQIFPSGFEMSLLSVTTPQPQVGSPQLITAQLTLINDQNTSLTLTPYLLEKDGIQYAPGTVDAAVAVYEAPTADTLKVKLAPITLAARETRTLDVPIVIARPDLTDPAVATAMTVDFGVNTADNRDVTATLNLNVSPRSEPAPASSLLQHLSTGPVADMGAAPAAPAALGTNRAGRLAISTELPSANGDYWDSEVIASLKKGPDGDEDVKHYLLLKRLGLSRSEAYAVLYLYAISKIRPEKASITDLFKLNLGAAQLWAQHQKAKRGLTPDFKPAARNILGGLQSSNALFFLNLMKLSRSYMAPLLSAMQDRAGTFESNPTRLTTALCNYVQDVDKSLDMPFRGLVEADLAYYMTNNKIWHPSIHHAMLDQPQVIDMYGYKKSLSLVLEEWMSAYENASVDGCANNVPQRNWVRIDVHSPLLPLVTDSQGRRFGIDAGGILHEEIPHAYIDPSPPWSMTVSVLDGALTIDYALAYPFDYGIEVQGVSNSIVTSKHVTQGTATAGFSLKQQATVSTTAQGVIISMNSIFDNGSQTISFGAAPSVAVGGIGTVSATASSGLAVSFTSSTPGACTVSGSTVTGIAAGICTIAANQAGNATYSAAPQVTQSITIVSTPSTLSASGASASAGGLTGIVSVTAATGSAWTATSNASWITVTSGSGGNGAGTVVYAVAVNTGASSRTGTLTIAGQTFTVTQAGASVASPGTWTALPGASPSRPSLALNAATGKTQMVVRSASDQLYVGNFNSGETFEGWNALPGASPSAVAQAWHPVLNKMFMVARAAGDQLYLGTFSSAGSFEGWSALSGASPSPVALAWHATLNKMFMVVRAANDQLYLGAFDSAGSFGGWSALSGASPSPVALAWHPASIKMVMAVRGADDQLWQGTFGSTSGAFEGWSALSGSSPTAPVLATGQSSLQLVVRSADDQLWSLLVQ